MNYETLIVVALVLLLIISFCVHSQYNRRKQRNVYTRPVIKKQRNLSPPGKGFAEYIPPARKCSPEKGCHTGSYVDFSTKNL